MTYFYVKIKIMSQAKVELFENDLREAAALFKALSHPARLAILKFLAETNSCQTGDISGLIPLGRTTVNQHLAELKKAGLIKGHITGIKTNYCINPEKIDELKKAMENLSGSLQVDMNFHCE